MSRILKQKYIKCAFIKRMYFLYLCHCQQRAGRRWRNSQVGLVQEFIFLWVFAMLCGWWFGGGWYLRTYSPTAFIHLKWSSMLDAHIICNRHSSLFPMLMLYELIFSSIFLSFTDLHVAVIVGNVHHIFTMQYLMKFYFKGSHKLHEYPLCVDVSVSSMHIIMRLCSTELFPCRNVRVAVSVGGTSLESLTAIREAFNGNVINRSLWGLYA